MSTIENRFQEAAESLKLSPGFLVNSAPLERLTRKDPAEAEVALPETLKCWQVQVLGEGLARALRAGGT